ncbi:hypothetical protein PSSHI_08560 [Photobacterium sp. R1]
MTQPCQLCGSMMREIRQFHEVRRNVCSVSVFCLTFLTLSQKCTCGQAMFDIIREEMFTKEGGLRIEEDELP